MSPATSVPLPALARLRVDHVGSLLRPASLRRAFARHDAGEASADELRAAQDDAIRAVVDEQVRRGLPVVGDGEFRRRNFLASLSRVSGLEEWDAHRHAIPVTPAGGRPQEQPTLDRVSPAVRRATRPLALAHNDLLDEFRFVRELTDRPAKVTLIGIDRVLFGYGRPSTGDVYPDVDAFAADLVAVQRQMIAELREAGCRYVSIDEPSLTGYVDDPSLAELRARGEDPQASLERAIRADNAVIARHAGVTFGVHLCRGNRRSLWHREGPYDAIAEQLFTGLDAHRFLLEYDTARAGTFAPLRFVPDDKVVVLGLVTTKTGTLESADALVRRIDEASRYVDVDRLAISPQCGFASVIEGNLLSEHEQWRKLELLLEVAERVWGRADADDAPAAA